MNYKVEVVEVHTLYVEADSKEDAQQIAADEYIWDGNGVANTRYGMHFNIEEIKK